MRIAIVTSLMILASALSVAGQYVYGDPATKRYFDIDCDEVSKIPSGTARGFKSATAAEKAGFYRSETCSKRGQVTSRDTKKPPVTQPSGTPEITNPRKSVQPSNEVPLSNATPTKLDAAGVYKKAAKSVIFITTIKPRGKSFGSGVILRSDGIIATNYHVIADAMAARIELDNGDVYDDVFIVETDPRKDIAILRIRGTNLPALATSNSDSVTIGDKIYTIGAPDGLSGSFSDGLVSGLRPANEYSPDLSGFRIIQFTAAVSSGSSGGALLDESARLVGLVSLGSVGVLQNKVAQNLNAAIPINYVIPLAINAKEEGQRLARVTEADLKSVSAGARSASGPQKTGTIADLEGTYTGRWASEDPRYGGTIAVTLKFVNGHRVFSR